MRDGIYQVNYVGASHGALGVFVIRNGIFNGVGPAGAFFEGTCLLDPKRGLYALLGTVTFKPNTLMVTGYISPESESTFPINGELSSPDPATRFSIEFVGRAIDVAASYVCPIPG